MRDRGVELAAVLLWFTACQGALFTFTTEGSQSTVVEEGTLLEALVSDLGFGELLEMEVVIEQALEDRGVEPGDVDGVYLEELVLTATAPDGGDLSFLGDLAVSVSGGGLPVQLVAWQDRFPEGQPSVPLNIEEVDLTDYVVAEQMSLVTEATGRRPDEETTLEAAFVIRIGATRQGLCNAARSRGEETGSTGS